MFSVGVGARLLAVFVIIRSQEKRISPMQHRALGDGVNVTCVEIDWYSPPGREQEGSRHV